MAAIDQVATSQIARVEQTTPLLRKLSPELRNIIYELTLAEKEIVDIIERQQPALTRVCHEIRNECLAMYYATNVFSYRTTSAESDGLDGLAKWLEKIGPHNCKQLVKLSVSIVVDNGLMIHDPRCEENAWTSLFRQMKKLGCSSRVKVLVNPKIEHNISEQMSQFQQAIDATQFMELVQSLLTSFRALLNLYLVQLGLDYPAEASARGKPHADATSYDVARAVRHLVFHDYYRLYAGRPELEPEVDFDEVANEFVRWLGGRMSSDRCTQGSHYPRIEQSSGI